MGDTTRRRALIAGGLLLGSTFAAGRAAADPPSIPLPPLPGNIGPQPQWPTTSPADFRSPPLARYVDALTVPPTGDAGGTLRAHEAVHRYHRDLPATRAWGYGATGADRHILGPTLTARSGEVADIAVVNALGRHILAGDVDTTMMGVTDRDRTQPRTTMHLHGAPTAPDSDGHPLITWRPGGTATHRYHNRQEAATLWYHDHAVGVTRLNVHAGLAGFYLVRDDFDTGAPDNPLGLPSGDQELPLVIADRTFNTDGSLQYRQFWFLPEGMNQGGQWGDVAVVNGTAWPRHTVSRRLYRLRLLCGANSRSYELAFANRMRFWVIGSDQGLIDRPSPVRSLVLTPGERADVLVDFGELADGESVELINIARNSIGNTGFMVPPLREIMRFDARGARVPARIPDTLRGGRRRPAALPPPRRPDRVRVVTLMWALNAAASLPVPVRAMLMINNLGFMSDDVDRARAGTVERWDIVNILPVEHPVHIHLARFRVLGRRSLDSTRYVAAHPPPVRMGIRWSPSPEGFTFGPVQGPRAWERGLKDTVHCPEDTVTSLLVYWPSAAELGFDPDAAIEVPDGAERAQTGPGMSDSVMSHSMNAADEPLRGYVWHCHNLDHEDHDMMQRIRVIG
ncbi:MULTISPECIES: multicopper oxidase family protein [unclassified Gordonia (in: high G+C Gram-positive bacteria)]